MNYDKTEALQTAHLNAKIELIRLLTQPFHQSFIPSILNVFLS